MAGRLGVGIMAALLGRGLLDRLLALDWIQRRESSRAVRITDTGYEGLRTTFGIDLSHLS